MCSGYAQGNLCILPKKYAYDFLLFCQRNPKSCPLLEVTDIGERILKTCAPGSDIATDIPKYRVWQNGKMIAEPLNVKDFWRDDLVSFIIGKMVVSMRPIPYSQIVKSVTVTARMPRVHGSPIHIGNPEAIGIKDLSKPDFGDAVKINDGEVPVFWCCGVTPQSVVMTSKPEFCITHSPGHMLITDLKNADLMS